MRLDKNIFELTASNVGSVWKSDRGVGIHGEREMTYIGVIIGLEDERYESLGAVVHTRRVFLKDGRVISQTERNSISKLNGAGV